MTLLGGAPSAHAALSDDNDTTQLGPTGAGSAVTVSLPDLTLPVGAVVKNVAARMRQYGFPPQTEAWALNIDRDDGVILFGEFLPQTVGQLTISTGSYVVVTAAEVNALRLRVTRMIASTQAAVVELYLNVIYVERPTLTVSTPTGTIESNQPTIEWAPTLDADGGIQTGYTVKIFSAAQYGAGGFNPETSPPTLGHEGIFSRVPGQSDGGDATSWTADTPLVDGTYRAYVRVAQSVGDASLFSEWEYSQFTVDAPVPGPPNMILTAESNEGRVLAEVTGVDGDATSDLIDLERSDDAGVTWVAVRGTSGLVARHASRDLQLRDYEAPNGSEVIYRARGAHDYGDGVSAVGAWTTGFVTLQAGWWIKHPHRPELNCPTVLKGYGQIDRGVRQGVFQPLGAPLPVVVSDTPTGETGQSVVRVDTREQHDRLRTILRTADVLLLQGPYDDGEPDRYVQFGASSAGRLLDNARFHRRDVSLPWAEVAKPAGGVSGMDYSMTGEMTIV